MGWICRHPGLKLKTEVHLNLDFAQVATRAVGVLRLDRVNHGRIGYRARVRWVHVDELLEFAKEVRSISGFKVSRVEVHGQVHAGGRTRRRKTKMEAVETSVVREWPYKSHGDRAGRSRVDHDPEVFHFSSVSIETSKGGFSTCIDPEMDSPVPVYEICEKLDDAAGIGASELE